MEGDFYNAGDLAALEEARSGAKWPQAHNSTQATNDPLWIFDGDWVEKDIELRKWIAPGYLLRQAVTVIVGAPSAGKSSLMLAFAAALARGEPFGRFRPDGPKRVAVYNVEDDRLEQQRRLSGLLQSMGCTPSDLARRLTLIGPTGVGTLLHFEQAEPVASDAMRQLEQHILKEKAAGRPFDVLILDPFAELHGADENDNTAIRHVLAYFRSFAIRHNIALVILHHTRKGLATPGDPDIARGASAIIGAARIVLTVTPMTEPDAAAFGLRPDQRRHFFRLDGAKSNYAPLEEAEWFQRLSRVLDNGDGVAVVEPWSPPVDAVSLDARTAIEAGIEAGSVLGPYSTKLSADARSIRTLFVAHGVVTAPGQKALLSELLAAGYYGQNFKRPGNRATATGLRTPSGLPKADWIEATDALI